MTVAIIDYGSGNLRSAAKAFERVAGNRKIQVTANPQDVLAADHIVLPGVGAFGDCRRGLFAIGGMVEALEKAVLEHRRPFLGICVGMQLMATTGIEFGEHQGLGWIAGTVKRMDVKSNCSELKIPHMGWNNLEKTPAGTEHSLVNDMAEGSHAYFVHSYSFFPEKPAHVLSVTDYGGPVTAIIGRDNMIGTQFHPEKSQSVGLRFLESFLSWYP